MQSLIGVGRQAAEGYLRTWGSYRRVGTVTARYQGQFHSRHEGRGDYQRQMIQIRIMVLIIKSKNSSRAPADAQENRQLSPAPLLQVAHTVLF